MQSYLLSPPNCFSGSATLQKKKKKRNTKRHFWKSQQLMAKAKHALRDKQDH